MKNLIVSLAALLTIGASPALANNTETNPRAERAFERQFAGAENVKWTELEGGYTRVLFTLNGIGVAAFYDSDAQFVGTIRNLLYNQLPLSVMQTLKNKFGHAAISEIKEITNEDGLNFSIVLEQKNKKYKVKINSLGYVVEKEKLGAVK